MLLVLCDTCDLLSVVLSLEYTYDRDQPTSTCAGSKKQAGISETVSAAPPNVTDTKQSRDCGSYSRRNDYADFGMKTNLNGQMALPARTTAWTSANTR